VSARHTIRRVWRRVIVLAALAAFRARVRFERAYPYVLGYSARTFVSVG